MKRPSSRPPNRSSDRPQGKSQAHSSSKFPSRPEFAGRSAPPSSAAAPKNARVIIGDHALDEFFLRNADSLIEIWVKDDWRKNSQLKKWAEQLSAPDRFFRQKPEGQLAPYGHHQGAVAFAKDRPELNLNHLAKLEKSVLLYLDGIADPHNLGAILRTAWLMKADGVLYSPDRAAGLTPTAHKVACGGVEVVPMLEVSQLQSVSKVLKEAGYWVFGLDHSARDSIYSKKLPPKVLWVIGNEEKGIRSTTKSECDEMISIPQVDAAASYNASVATALALGETVRQHRLS